jgi:hypothetical protein
VLPLSPRRLFLATHRVDFRRRFDGLLAEARKIGADPYSGDCVVFMKGDFTQIRVITGDPIGLYLISRRFEGSRLKRFFNFVADPGATTISRAELSMLLEGSSYTIYSRASAWKDQ